MVALAVSTATRLRLPDADDRGGRLKDAAYAFWNGIFVPAKTPRDIVGKLYQETQKALELASLQERLAKVGQDPLPMTTEEFEKYFRDDVTATARLMKEAGVQPQD